MRSFFLLLISFIFLTNCSCAQSSAIDSLKWELQNAKQDSARLIHLIDLSAAYYQQSDANNAEIYIVRAKDIVKNLISKVSDDKESNYLKLKSGEVYLQTGRIFHLRGNYAEELRNYLEALRIFEEMNYAQGMAPAFNNIGRVYRSQGNYSEALKNQLQALKIYETIGNKKNLVVSCVNVGATYISLKNYEEALKYLYRGLKIGEEAGDKRGVADTYNNIGGVQRMQGNIGAALKSQMKAMLLREELGERRGMATSYANVGELYIDLGRYPEAITWLKKAVQMASEISDKEIKEDVYANLSRAYKELNNYKSAFEYQDLSFALKDSLKNQESDRQIAEMKTKYETEKKDQQIRNQELINDILQTRIKFYVALSILIIGIVALLFYLRIRRKKNEYNHTITLLELSMLKAQLNPHFISNALSAIKAFIDREPERASHFLSKFARLIRRVLEQTEQSLISLEDELSTAELYMQIESLRIDYGFDYRIDIDTSVDAKELMVPPLILQPAIENAIWHGLAAKAERGYVNIIVKLEKDLLKVAIEDNGVGERSGPANPNVNPQEKKSFGLLITRKRIALLSKEMKRKGNFNLSFLDGRTIAEIALPVNAH